MNPQELPKASQDLPMGFLELTELPGATQNLLKAFVNFREAFVKFREPFVKPRELS